MKLFLDNNLSPRLAKALSALEGEHGNEVIHLRDKYAPNAPDTQWMTELAKEGAWIVITSDYRISKSPHELRAWKEAGLVVFFLRKSWRSLKFWDQAWQLTKQWPSICQEASHASPGQGYIVPLKGTIFARV